MIFFSTPPPEFGDTPYGANDWAIQFKDGYYFKASSTGLSHPFLDTNMRLHERLYHISKASGIYRDGIYTEIIHPVIIHPEPTCCCSIL